MSEERKISERLRDRLSLGPSGVEIMGYLLELLPEIEKLEAGFGFTYCAYCGESFKTDAPDATDHIGKHITVCPKHPMREVERERDGARATLYRLWRACVDADIRGGLDVEIDGRLLDQCRIAVGPHPCGSGDIAETPVLDAENHPVNPADCAWYMSKETRYVGECIGIEDPFPVRLTRHLVLRRPDSEATAFARVKSCLRVPNHPGSESRWTVDGVEFRLSGDILDPHDEGFRVASDGMSIIPKCEVVRTCFGGRRWGVRPVHKEQ